MCKINFLISAFLVVLGITFNSCSKDKAASPAEPTIAQLNQTLIPNKPVAKFSYVSSATKLNYTFTNLSTNATSYSWDFGDSSGTSTATSPVHVYSSNGFRTVKLTASNIWGDSIVSTLFSVSNSAYVNFSLVGVHTYVYKSASYTATNTSNGINIAANDGGNDIFTINIPPGASAGNTYNTKAALTSLSYRQGNTIYTANSSSATCSSSNIKITSINANVVVGTFSGRVDSLSTCTGFGITNGAFSVAY